MSIGKDCDISPTPVASSASNGEFADLARRLRSLHEGDVAVVDAISTGVAAIGVLRELLFEPDSAGIFEPRTRAVQALAALGATGALKQYVQGWEPARDPVERLGDEAVLGAAARALGATPDEEVYPLLMTVARKCPVPGVIEALGRYGRVESMPILVRALADDLSRSAAEQAFKILGAAAIPTLIDIASRPVMNFSGYEISSSIRRRRSALMILLEMAAFSEAWDRVGQLVADPDREIAASACIIGMAVADDTERRDCAHKLVGLLRVVAWPLNRQIQDRLIENFAVAREFVDQALSGLMDDSANDIERARLKRSLRRLRARAST